MGLVKVCPEEALASGKAKMVEVDGVEVGVFRVDGEVYAIENTCPHREGYLHEGRVEETTVTCPWHFAVFDLKTGKVLEGPAETDRKTYRVVCQGGDIHVADD